jgi:hypothetical protein
MKIKGAVFVLSITASLAMLVTLVFTVFAAGPYNVEVADRTGFNEATLDDGAIVQYIGDLNTTYGSAGTGTFNSFVRIQGNEKKTPYQRGYNTDGKPEFDTKSGIWTHSILLSEIPTIKVGGNLYWEFFADINESDNKPKITLDDFELWLTDDPELDVYATFGTYAVNIYDYDDLNTDYILINDVNQGSGRGDLRYLVPQDGFDPGDCNYGNPACDTYLILYSRWGGKGGDYLFDGGFEEWKVKKYPILQVSKTVEGSYETPVSWTIDKTPDATYDLFSGESVIHEYTVSVTPTLGDPENVLVSGVITIVGDEDEAVNATVEDMFNGSAADITGCSVSQNLDGTYPIAAGATVTCTYELDLTDPVDGTNVATASFEFDGTSLAFQGEADILASEFIETLTGYPDINVTDTNGESWSTADATAASWTYTETFSCDADEGANLNTASITETGQSDTATVTLNCYELTVTKTANEFFTRTYQWDITKSVSPATWDLFSGESGVSDYTVILDQTGYTDSNFYVSGGITILNSHPTRQADLTQVLDSAGSITASVTCPNLIVAAGGSLNCTYTTTPQSSASPFGSLNTATATQQLYNFDEDGVASLDGTKNYQGTAPIDFSGALMTEVDEQVTVSDTYAGSNVTGTATGDKTFNYSRTFTCDANEGKHDNTASFVTNDTATTGSDDASVTVNCHDLSINKTVDESYTRTFTWNIDKQVDNPGPITVPLGGSVTLNYSVILDATYVDSNFQIAGSITITNNHPSKSATINSVTDLAGSVNGVVVCPASTVAANGGTLVCTYTTPAQSSAAPFGSSNVATANQQLYNYNSSGVPTANGTKNYSDSEAIDFSSATVTYVDEIITLTDTLYGNLGTVNALLDSLPKTINYAYTYTAPAGFCGETTVDNTAAFTTNDTGATGSDSVSVPINVPCGEGCTPGFWQGGAGAQLWDEVNDPDWDAGDYATQFNPFIHATLFNSFFSGTPDSRLDSLTMMDLVGSGGTSDWAVKAARDMVAAYLNESAFPASFPATSLADLVSAWYAAVSGGDPALIAFHTLVSGWNNPPGGSCPLP